MTYKNKTITKHRRGNWYVRVRHNGKVITIYGHTQIECYNKLKIIADKIEIEKSQKILERLTATNIVIKPTTKRQSTYTLKEWFDEWLQSYKVGNVRQATITGFTKDIKHLQFLYNTDITEITNLMLSKAINECSANRMKDKVHNLCKQMFSCAFNNRIIETNPTLNLARPKQYAKFEKKALTPEQETKFIELCLANLPKYEPLLILVLQGMRKGEMLALRPNDFDFEQNTLRIDESYDHNNPDDLQTKNATSKRTMPMFDLTKQILLKYKDCDQKQRIYEHINGITLNGWLAKLLKQNNLPRLTLHELRHTFITRCHEKGIDEIIVQKWVGHAIGSRMTKQVYTHTNDDAERNAIETLNNKN